jgi:hypothetical protein
MQKENEKTTTLLFSWMASFQKQRKMQEASSGDRTIFQQLEHHNNK